MVTLGWVLTILGIAFIVIGLLLGALTLLKELRTKAVEPGVEPSSIPVPGLGGVIGALIKTPSGLIAAVGLVLLIIGLSLLGANVTPS